MLTKPTLLVLAAGMATRYGSLKQLDSFGPNGETIIDYSVYDARRAGFGKIVFVIRASMQAEFQAILRRLPANLEVVTLNQELDLLPPTYLVPVNRSKPWGTGHAVWVAAAAINEPFAVVNGDDFYGFQSFKLAADFLRDTPAETDYGLVGFKLENTLSEHGAVSRGECQTNPQGYLQSLTEQPHIVRTDDGIAVLNPDAAPRMLTGQELVSMNLLALKPAFFSHVDQELKEFLRTSGTDPNAEFYLPLVIDKMVKANRARVKVLETPEKWFGVTYPADKPAVVQNIQRLVHESAYPNPLFTAFNPIL
ncbi:NTP transferase domain-containing protein (plasmid) [Hymenobacter tibetensis]|uniref:NTP transferase domain-containing protein n=1 Tax=Hymenobacter tibetensis TaxID=497967 RepID=A0ABY4D4U4_9BACT|nr:sugar phosphate nucleotidyltransferase [Hymenobacter tibetensis]UOG77383.1 NTP transferase domain-containing protein [Hymenobacter tibetensis]